jgi:integrase
MLVENNVRQGFLERPQFDALRKHLPAPLRPIATFMYYTGWRVHSELLRLQWHQVDRATGIVRLEPGTTKNQEGRTFPYGQVAELREAIETQWQAREALTKRGIICPWVFHRRGKRIKDFRTAWDAAAAAAGCPGRIPHDCRRTAVRNLTRAGVTETVAMKITGHKTRSVFDRYDITSEADRRMRRGSSNGSRQGQLQGQSHHRRRPTPPQRRKLLRKLVPEVGIEPTRGVNPTGF